MSNIDPQMVQQIIQFLAMYGTPAGIAAAQTIGTSAAQALGSGATKAIKSLWGKIRHMSEQEGGIAESAVTAFEAAPNDAEHQQTLSFILRQLCSNDSTFANEITQLFDEIQRDPIAEQFIQHISGKAQVGMAGVNYGSVTINQTTHQMGINEEDFAKLREEMDRKLQAQILFSKAENTISLVECEKLIREALQKYPDLTGARSYLGLRMSNEVQEYFSYQMQPGTSPQMLERLGGSVTPMYYTQFAQTPAAPPILKAIHWLEEALQHQDNPEGNITASLALMYGLNDDYGRMIDTIKKAHTINSSLISYIQRPHNLMMLIYACHDLASIEEVMRNVNLKLPQKDEVQQAIREASDPKNNPYVDAQPFIEWYAVELRMGKTSKMPVTVRVVFPKKNGTTYAQVSPLSQASVTIPKQTSTTGIVDTFIPVEDILKRLTDIGIVLITLI